jgi:hypothetical protein
MPYRRMPMGDYYTGDYYTGDPFLGSLIPWAARGIGAIAGLFGKGRKALPAATTVLPGAITMSGRAGAIVRAAGGMVRAHPAAAAGAAAAGIASLGIGAGEMLAPAAFPGGLQPRGYHMSKPHRHYMTGPRPPHLVRNRRMRVTNVKALRRAIRRASGFSRIARRVLHFTSPRPPRGRPYFKSRKRARHV